MAAILQMTYVMLFSCTKSVVFQFEFQSHLFPETTLVISQQYLHTHLAWNRCRTGTKLSSETMILLVHIYVNLRP